MQANLKKLSTTFQDKFETFFQQENFSSYKKLKVGDFVQISYKIPEGDKERIQNYQGLIISEQNKELGKSITIRRKVENVGVEQIFLLNSPKIVNIKRKESSRIRRAKLYFLRNIPRKLAKQHANA